MIDATWQVDAVIAVTVAEGIVLCAWRRRGGSGFDAISGAANLLAGLCLLVALRGSLHGAASPWLALWLSAASCAHLADLWLRWQRKRR